MFNQSTKRVQVANFGPPLEYFSSIGTCLAVWEGLTYFKCIAKPIK